MKKIIIAIFLLFDLMSTAQTTILMEEENGVYLIPCKVNGIPMKFIFDTGASDVSISLTEAKFLIKQGLLNDKDVIGNVKYKIANGDIEEGTKVILKEINIEGYILENVEASIIYNLDAPLLLGQSAISKLGTFQLDGDKLIINEKENNFYTFLNIDLTKTYSDFGFNPYFLKSESKNGFLPVPMHQITTENHFLNHLNLNTEVVVFEESGQISMIILGGGFETGNLIEKESKAKELFENLVSEITKKYGNPNSRYEKVADWKSINYEIYITLNSENEVLLMYMPKIIFKNNYDKITEVEKKEKSNEENSKEHYRSWLKNLINEDLNDKSSRINGLSAFCRITNNDLEYFYEISVTDKATSNKMKIRLVNTFFIDAMKKLYSGEEIKQIIQECDFNNIIFNLHLTDGSYNKYKMVKKITKQNLQNLKAPCTESEIIEILE